MRNIALSFVIGILFQPILSFAKASEVPSDEKAAVEFEVVGALRSTKFSNCQVELGSDIAIWANSPGGKVETVWVVSDFANFKYSRSSEGQPALVRTAWDRNRYSVAEIFTDRSGRRISRLTVQAWRYLRVNKGTLANPRYEDEWVKVDQADCKI